MFESLGQTYRAAVGFQNAALTQAPPAAFQAVLTANLGAVPASGWSVQPIVLAASTASTTQTEGKQQKGGTIIDGVGRRSGSGQRGKKGQKDEEHVGGKRRSGGGVQ